MRKAGRPKKAQKPPERQHKTWTPEEEIYLTEAWGNVSLSHIMMRLQRSKDAIIVRARRLKLGAYLEKGDEYITLMRFLGYIGKSTGGDTVAALKKRGLKIRNKRVNDDSFQVVYVQDIWPFLEANRDFIDFNKIEPHTFGKEPAWVKDQRRRQFYSKKAFKKTKWTAQEDKKLMNLVNENLSYKDISQRLARSEGAIERRLVDLGVKMRPVKAYNHNKWTPQEEEMIYDILMSGGTYYDMAQRTFRSERAIRGYIYRVYGSENIDKARKTAERLGY